MATEGQPPYRAISKDLKAPFGGLEMQSGALSPEVLDSSVVQNQVGDQGQVSLPSWASLSKKWNCNIKFTGRLQGIREGEKVFKERPHGSLQGHADPLTHFKARRLALPLVTAPVL